MKTIFGPNFKIHLVLDENSLINVFNDLQHRFVEVSISEEKPPFVNDGATLWDPGGALSGNDIKFSFKVSDELSLICRSQHWFLFKKSVVDMIKNKKKSYLKLHSQTFALVLSEDQASRLMSQIIKNSSKFDLIAATTLERVTEINF